MWWASSLGWCPRSFGISGDQTVRSSDLGDGVLVCCSLWWVSNSEWCLNVYVFEFAICFADRSWLGRISEGLGQGRESAVACGGWCVLLLGNLLVPGRFRKELGEVDCVCCCMWWVSTFWWWLSLLDAARAWGARAKDLGENVCTCCCLWWVLVSMFV